VRFDYIKIIVFLWMDVLYIQFDVERLLECVDIGKCNV